MKSPLRFSPALFSAMAALLVSNASAQNYTWSGTSASQSWDDASFWSPSGPPSSTGTIVNPTATGTAAVQIENGTRTIKDIILSGASFSVIGGNSSSASSSLVLTGSLSKTGSGAVVFRDSTGPLSVEIQGGLYFSGGTLRFGSNATNQISGVKVSGTTTLAGGTATHMSINMVNGGTANFEALNFATNTNLSIRESTVSGTSTLKVTSLSGASGVIQNTTNSSSVVSRGILLIDTTTASSFGGVIRDSSGSATNSTLSLIKAGSGTQTLTNTNSYSGGTAINAGTLVLTGTGSIGTGALSVAQGATFDVSGISASTFTHGASLSGGGTINATGKTFVANGVVNPGDNLGTLNVTGNLTLGSSAATTLQIAGAGAGQFDTIAATGLLTYGGGLTLSFDSIIAGGLVDLALFDFSTTGGAFSSVSLTGAYAASLTLLGDIWSGTVGGQTFSFEQSTGLLNVSAVPEPATLALLGLGLAAVLWRRRSSRA